MIKTTLVLVSGFAYLVGADFNQPQAATDKISDSVHNSSFKDNNVEAHTTPPTSPFSSSTSMISQPGETNPSSRKPGYGSFTPSPAPNNPTTWTGPYIAPPSQYEQHTKITIAASSTTSPLVISTSVIHTQSSLAESILHTEGTSYPTFSLSVVPKTSLSRELPSASTSAVQLTTRLELQAPTSAVTGSPGGNTQYSFSLDRTWPSYANTKTRDDVISTAGSSKYLSTYDGLFSSTKSRIQTDYLSPTTEAPKFSARTTAEVLASLTDYPGIPSENGLTSEVSLTFRSEFSIVVTFKTIETTTYGAASGNDWQHSDDGFLTETESRSDISLTTQTIVEDSSTFTTKAMTDSGVRIITTRSKYSSKTDDGPMISSSYFPTSSSKVPQSSDPTIETSHAVLKDARPPTTGTIGTSNETSSDHYLIPTTRLDDQPANLFDTDEPTFVTTVSSAALSSMIRPAVKYATSKSKILDTTPTTKLAEGPSTRFSVVSDLVQASLRSSTRANGPNMLPVTTVGSIASSAELELIILPTKNGPVQSTASEAPITSSNPKTYSQTPKANEQSSQGQQANTIGIATGAVSASVMCGIIVFLIARKYRTKKAHRPLGIKILTNSSRKSSGSVTTSTESSTTMNERGRGWGPKPYPSHNRPNESFDRKIISYPLSGGNSLGL